MRKKILVVAAILLAAIVTATACTKKNNKKENKETSAQTTTNKETTEKSTTTVKETTNTETTTVAETTTEVETETETTTPAVPAEEKYPWLTDLHSEARTSQLIVVSNNGENGAANIYMFTMNPDGSWNTVVEDSAVIGVNGLDKISVDDGKTPTGMYTFTQAFGTAADPGSQIGYTVVDSSFYWCNDASSDLYNTMVSTNNSSGYDLNQCTHFTEYGGQFEYALAFNFNTSKDPSLGSGVFLRCNVGENSTDGSIAVSRETMQTILQNLTSDSTFVIANAEVLS